MQDTTILRNGVYFTFEYKDGDSAIARKALESATFDSAFEFVEACKLVSLA